MPDLDKLSSLIAPEAKALGFSLVRVAWFSNGAQGSDEPTLQVMAERPETRQLNIDDCAALSHRISDLFDELDPIVEAYRLEVSSPGIDRPLTRLADFADWVGHEAKIELSEPMGANVGVPDLDLPIEDLDLSERPRNCLKRGQINTIGELLLKSIDDLLNITNFGQKSLDEIIQKLDERGLTLRA